jgi:hypothetical protein
MNLSSSTTTSPTHTNPDQRHTLSDPYLNSPKMVIKAASTPDSKKKQKQKKSKNPSRTNERSGAQTTPDSFNVTSTILVRMRAVPHPPTNLARPPTRKPLRAL